MNAIIISFFWPILTPVPVTDGLDLLLHKLVYQAEVHRRSQEGLEQMRVLLENNRNPSGRTAIIRAMSVIKKSINAKVQLAPDQPVSTLIRQSQAIILHPPFAYLYSQGVWLELGDWIGHSRIMDITFQQISLEDSDQQQKTLPLPRLLENEPSQNGEGGKFLNAPISEILAFATRQDGLNFFFPSAFNDTVSGFFPVPDWQRLIDQLCQQAQIIWTRRHGSIVFELGTPNPNLGTMIRGIDTKNRRLGSLLQEIADIVGLELVVFDENLREVAIDLYLADQPWNEVLDCLSIMNGFNWALVPQKEGSGQLIVTRN